MLTEKQQKEIIESINQWESIGLKIKHVELPTNQKSELTTISNHPVIYTDNVENDYKIVFGN